MQVNVRVLALIAVGALAVSANAQNLILDSYGTWGGSNGVTYTQTETLLYPPSITGTLPVLTNLSAVVSIDGGGNNTTAVATYSNGSGDSLVLDWTYTNNTYVGSNLSDTATWVYAGGTGAYSALNIAGGSGTVANSQGTVNFPSTSGFSGTVLVGDLQAVPEPASFAVLGLGVVGLLVARRRS